MASQPKTQRELFKFYQEYVKPLYSAVQAENVLPNEVLFELNATLDHLSRIWTYGEAETQAVEKAYSHLKRACLDIFKLKVKDAIDQYKELKTLNTEFIDNGKFDNELNKLYIDIKQRSKEARSREGDTREDNQAIVAFDLWQPVYAACVRMETEFYNNENVNWSHHTKQRRDAKAKWVERGWGFLIGLLGSIVFWWAMEKAPWIAKEPPPSTMPASQHTPPTDTFPQPNTSPASQNATLPGNH